MIYLSTANHLFSELELQQILQSSRVNNTSMNLSGMLLYHDGSIMQVLEGEESVVIALFERLQKDTRHHGIFKVMDGEIENRYFPDWSMGFQKLGSGEWDKVTGYLPVSKKELQFSPVAGTSKEMLTFIRSFCNANFN